MLRKLLSTLAILLLCLILLFYTTPWPGAMVIRFLFDRDTVTVQERLEKHRPAGIGSILNLQYAIGDDDAHLDVYFPDSISESQAQLPTIIWTHGGGWLSGSKSDAAIYFQVMAQQGCTVIALDYSLAPEEQYPKAIQQVNKALEYIAQNAERLHVDPDRIILVGDSAGAQITSQIATLITNPEYAASLEISPAIRPEQLRGIALWCGFYDTQLFIERGELTTNTFLHWGTGVMVWAYTGSRTPDSTIVDELSTIRHVTSAYPATFISGGNADPLTEVHSVPFTEKLRTLGVPVTTLFFPADHEPPLGHEYQFNLDNQDGQDAFAAMMGFVNQQTAM